MKPVVLRSARTDILRQFNYYVEIGRGDIAERFLGAAQQSVETLARTPDAGSPRHFQNPRLAGLRSWPVAGFQDSRIYYLSGPDGPTVLRILHGKRDIEQVLDEDDTAAG